MNRNQCLEILNNKEHPDYKEFLHLFRINYNKCRKYYDSLGFKGYTLHHKVLNCDNYEEWKIEEIEPMTRADHSRLHMVYYKQGLGSKESIEKAHRNLKNRYESGDLHAWNKGLTKETDSRIKESPRRGKTGEDFPFLKASKKGKSGGWNKGITKDDLRYQSLKHSDKQKQKQSEFMKNNNPMYNPESIKKLKETLNNPDIQNKRIEKIKGRKKYTNGVEVHMYKPGEEPEGYFLAADFKERFVDG